MTKARVLVPRSDWRLPTEDELEIKPRAKAVMKCPACRIEQTIRTHTINENGEVNPSSVCPHKHANCSFHAYVTLEGWNGQV